MWTGLLGLSLLAFQAMLPLFFAESPGARGVVSFCFCLFGVFVVRRTSSSGSRAVAAAAHTHSLNPNPKHHHHHHHHYQHAYLGSSILALFFVHAALGLQLGLSI